MDFKQLSNFTPMGFGWLDALAMACLALMIVYFNIRIETVSDERPSTHSLMTRHRYQWMQVLTTRDNRIVDATILNMLQQSARFFASGMMISIGGLLALTSKPEVLSNLQAIAHTDIPAELWNFKLFFTAIILANGFLKFLWSGRVFGYCAIVMAAIPETDETAARIEGRRAAELNITASRSFNRGLRMIYFALASLCWLLGAAPFLIAIGFVGYTIWRREFNSKTRDALLERNNG